MDKMMSVLQILLFITAGCIYGDDTSWFVSEVSTFVSVNRTACLENDEPPPNRVNTTEKLRVLRQLMSNQSIIGGAPLHAFIVNNADEHQGSGAPHYRRMEYISGFRGSAGLAVIYHDQGAVLFTDGRYIQQADEELDCNWSIIQTGAGVPPDLVANLFKQNSRIGSDPTSLTVRFWIDLSEFLLESRNVSLVVVRQNPVDIMWTDQRPPRTRNPIFNHQLEFSGEAWQEKVTRVRHIMSQNSADVFVVSSLDQTAWLLNLRGSDYTYSPLFYSYVVLTKNTIRLYIQNTTWIDTEDVFRFYVDRNCRLKHCIQISDYEAIWKDLLLLSNDQTVQKIWISPDASYAVFSATNKKAFILESPIKKMKAVKNLVQREKYPECQIRDSAAIVEFAAFLEKQVAEGHHWTEMSAAMKLNDIRSTVTNFKGLSFPTISAIGPHAAMPHYIPTNITDRPITNNELYVLDSGGQYLDGTTDTTRTFHYGNASDWEKECYTRVLMGHIDLASVIWPEGTPAFKVDALARMSLWEKGLDYAHGSGHGIGYFLVVHEGPGYVDGAEPLQEGMFSSVEPGYYEVNQFGIRLESVMGVVNANILNSAFHKKWLTFSPVTLVPFETKLIKYELLSPRQRDWINQYNMRCRQEVGNYLRAANKMEALQWLWTRTEPIPSIPVYQET